MSGDQLDSLLAARRPVVSVLDGDAWLEGYGMAMMMRTYNVRAGAVGLPPLTDPDEVPRDLLMAAARESLASPTGRVVLE
jgi:hypothetical protein